MEHLFKMLFNVVNDLYLKGILKLDMKTASFCYFAMQEIIPRDIELIERETFENNDEINIIKVYNLWKKLVIQTQAIHGGISLEQASNLYGVFTKIEEIIVSVN